MLASEESRTQPIKPSRKRNRTAMSQSPVSVTDDFSDFEDHEDLDWIIRKNGARSPAGRSTNLKQKRKTTEHTCSICQKSFTKLSRLTRHQRMHTGEKPFQCDVCGSSYARKDHLLRHMASHTKDYRYPCQHPGCCAAFHERSRLERHQLKAHSASASSSEYPCDVEGCLASFKKKSQLKRHSYVHTGVLPFACEVEGCGRRYMTQKSLKRHAEMHCGLLFVCGEEGCGLLFSSPAERRKHQSEHSATCDVCQKTFKRLHSLRAHQEIHEQHGGGKIEFKCPYPECSSSFSRRNNLTKHIRVTHEAATAFVCHKEDCGRTFGYKHVLERHLERVHGEKSEMVPKEKEAHDGEHILKEKTPSLAGKKRKSFLCKALGLKGEVMSEDQSDGVQLACTVALC